MSTIGTETVPLLFIVFSGDLCSIPSYLTNPLSRWIKKSIKSYEKILLLRINNLKRTHLDLNEKCILEKFDVLPALHFMMKCYTDFLGGQ